MFEVLGDVEDFGVRDGETETVGRLLPGELLLEQLHDAVNLNHEMLNVLSEVGAARFVLKLADEGLDFYLEDSGAHEYLSSAVGPTDAVTVLVETDVLLVEVVLLGSIHDLDNGLAELDGQQISGGLGDHDGVGADIGEQKSSGVLKHNYYNTRPFVA